MAHDVFVSYSSNDSEIAQAAVKQLEATGVRCWIAPRDIKAGQVWAQAIVDAIAGSKVMVVVFSASANRSGHVTNEVDAAIRKGANVVPFRIESVLPEGAMEYHLRTRHWLDALSGDPYRHLAELAKVVSGLVADANGKLGQEVPVTEYGRWQAPPTPVPDSKSKPRFASTDTGYHVSVPKVPMSAVRGRWPLLIGAVVVLSGAVAGTRWFLGSRPVSGVEFEYTDRRGGNTLTVKFKTEPLRFFETARQLPPISGRQYHGEFTSSQTRFVGVELTFRGGAPGRLITIPASCAIFKSNDDELGTLEFNAIVQPGWQGSVRANNWGADSPGSFQPDRYRVDCRSNNKLLARGFFTVN